MKQVYPIFLILTLLLTTNQYGLAQDDNAKYFSDSKKSNEPKNLIFTEAFGPIVGNYTLGYGWFIKNKKENTFMFTGSLIYHLPNREYFFLDKDFQTFDYLEYNVAKPGLHYRFDFRQIMPFIKTNVAVGVGYVFRPFDVALMNDLIILVSPFVLKTQLPIYASVDIEMGPRFIHYYDGVFDDVPWYYRSSDEKYNYVSFVFSIRLVAGIRF